MLKLQTHTSIFRFEYLHAHIGFLGGIFRLHVFQRFYGMWYNMFVFLEGWQTEGGWFRMETSFKELGSGRYGARFWSAGGISVVSTRTSDRQGSFGILGGMEI